MLSNNSSPPGQNGRHFADDILKYIFMNEKSCILIPKGPIDNPTIYNGCDYLSMLGLKLNHASKRGHRQHTPLDHSI